MGTSINVSDRSLLVTLPSINIPEIYSNILSFCKDASTLAILMRTSSVWYELAGPLLYRSLTYDVSGIGGISCRDVHPDLSILPPFGTLRPSSINHNSIVRKPPSTYRTPRKELFKQCRVLRVLPHYAVDHATDFPLGYVEGYPNIKPEILILDMKGKEEHICWYDSDDESTASHIVHGLEHPCSIINSCSPSKIIIRGWTMPCVEPIDGLPGFTSIQSVVVVLSDLIFLSSERPVFTLPLCGTADYGMTFWPGKPAASTTIIFPDPRCNRADELETTLWVEWTKHCARDMLENHIVSSSHHTTFVNTDAILSFSDEYDEAPKTFVDALKILFFKHTDHHRPDVTEQQMEECWSRVKFVTKEEYLKKDPKDLEGELDSINW